MVSDLIRLLPTEDLGHFPAQNGSDAISKCFMSEEFTKEILEKAKSIEIEERPPEIVVDNHRLILTYKDFAGESNQKLTFLDL